MTPEFDVVRAAPEHLDAVATLFDGYRSFYGQESDVTGARDFLSGRMKRDESVIFLALNGAVGLGFTQLYPMFSSVSMKRLWVLNDLFVAPEARGRGVAAALLEHAREFARKTGASEMQLATAADNLPAQRLYERLGWKRDDDFYHYAFVL